MTPCLLHPCIFSCNYAPRRSFSAFSISHMIMASLCVVPSSVTTRLIATASRFLLLSYAYDASAATRHFILIKGLSEAHRVDKSDTFKKCGHVLLWKLMIYTAPHELGSMRLREDLAKAKRGLLDVQVMTRSAEAAPKRIATRYMNECVL